MVVLPAPEPKASTSTRSALAGTRNGTFLKMRVIPKASTKVPSAMSGVRVVCWVTVDTGASTARTDAATCREVVPRFFTVTLRVNGAPGAA